MRQKQLYAAPATEVLELHLEGAIASLSVEKTELFNTDPSTGDGEDW